MTKPTSQQPSPAISPRVAARLEALAPDPGVRALISDAALSAYCDMAEEAEAWFTRHFLRAEKAVMVAAWHVMMEIGRPYRSKHLPLAMSVAAEMPEMYGCEMSVREHASLAAKLRNLSLAEALYLHAALMVTYDPVDVPLPTVEIKTPPVKPELLETLDLEEEEYEGT